MAKKKEEQRRPNYPEYGLSHDRPREAQQHDEHGVFEQHLQARQLPEGIDSNAGDQEDDAGPGTAEVISGYFALVLPNQKYIEDGDHDPVAISLVVQPDEGQPLGDRQENDDHQTGQTGQSHPYL